MNSRMMPRQSLSLIAGTLLGLAFLLHLRRYAGINHDAVLYLGQALFDRWPEIFSNDPFFSHGSQGKYSLFPWLVSHLFEISPPPAVFLWGTLACTLLFAAAGWYCLRALLPEQERYWAWISVLCLPSVYGMAGMFGYGEQFLTPRPIAEMLCLLAIGLIARRRWIMGIACMILAGLFHPLQAIAATLIIWPWAIMRDRRWLHAGWLVIPVLVLAIVGVRPFDGLFQQADPLWLSSLREYTRQLFVSQWGFNDFMLLGFDMLVLGYSWRTLQGPFGRWCAASLIGLVLGFSATLLLVDVLHLTLPAGLQLWRVHWLAHWFAMAAIGALLFHDINAGNLPRALLLALTLLLVWSNILWLAIPAALLYLAWSRVFATTGIRVQSLLGWLFSLVMAALFTSYILEEWPLFRMAHFRLDLYAIDRRILAYPVVGLTLLLPCAWAWPRISRRWQWIMVVAILCPLIALGALRWDSRPVINRAYEQNALNLNVFGASLPETSQIFWDSDSLTGPWLVLGRASYFSPGQFAGQVFNRGTTMDGNERLKRMRPLIEEGLYCQDRTRSKSDRETCHISNNAMFQACTPLLGRAPDYLVLTYPQPQHAIGKWNIIDPVTHEPAATYNLYKCSDVLEDLRRSRPPATPH